MTDDQPNSQRLKILVLGNARSAHVSRWTEAFAKHGHEVHLASIRSADIPGVKVHTRAIGPLNSTTRRWSLLSYLWLLVSARSISMAIGPDVVNAHFSITHGTIAALCRLRPLVITTWGRDVIASNGELRGWQASLNRRVLRHADLVTVTSAYMVDPVLRLGATAKTTKLVPFGVDTSRFHPELCREPSEGSRQKSFTIGFVKHLKPQYDPESLVRAFPNVLRRVPNAELIMVGDGELLNDLVDLTEELDVVQAVKFLGRMEHNDIPALMRTFDVLVNPSIEESFGVVLLEASASAVPVIAARVGGVSETVLHKKTGFLIPPRDVQALSESLIGLYEDSDLRLRMGEAGRKFVKHNYEWDGNVRQMLNLFTEIDRTASRPWKWRLADRLDPPRPRPFLRFPRRIASRAYMSLLRLTSNPAKRIKTRNFEMFIDLRDRTVTPHLYWHGDYEAEESALVSNFVTPGSVCIDVGANFGYYTITLAIESAARLVIAVEPDELNLSILRRNIELNGLENVEVLPIALGATTGHAVLHRTRGNFGGHYLNRTRSPKGTQISVQPLDDVVADPYEVSFVKIDVEGSEPDVLAGMQNVLIQGRPVIQIEINPGALSRLGHEPRDVLLALSAHGYTMHVAKGGAPTAITDRHLLALAKQTGHINVIAMPKQA